MRKIRFYFLLVLVSVCTNGQLPAQTVVDFEELNQFTGDSPLGGGQFYNGNDGSRTTNDDGWSSGGVFFNNSYTNFGSFDSWSGWSYSNVVNQVDPGFLNQYAAWSGGGANGSGGANAGENYAVAFGSGAYFNLPANSLLSSLELTNSTYAGLSMLNGDSFAKVFGGDTGDDPDFFRIILNGFSDTDGMGDSVGSVSIELADYRFADNSLDFILDDWLKVDLSSFNGARSLVFEFESSDVGQFGINTPTYVALDNLTFTVVPEPSGATIVGLATIGLLLWRRKGQLMKE